MSEKLQIKPDRSKFHTISEYAPTRPTFIPDYEECKKAYQGAVCFVLSNRNIWLCDSRYAMDDAPFLENHVFFVPAASLAAALGAEFTYDDTAAAVTIGGICRPALIKREIPYAPLREFAEALGLFYFESVKGIAFVSEKPLAITEELAIKGDIYVPLYVVMMNYIIYERPNAARIKEMFLQQHPEPEYPFIYSTPQKLARLKELAVTDPVIRDWSDQIIAAADDYVKNYTFRPQVYDYYTRFTDCCPMTSDVMSLCWAYLMTGDTGYSDKAIAAAMHVAAFPTWSARDHNISVCIPTDSCVAVLDFLQDQLTSFQKYTLISALYNKTVVPAFGFWNGKVNPKSPAHMRTNNWNSSANSAVAAAALAVMRELDMDLCCEAIENAVRCVERVLHNFAPDGAWTESLGYWGIAVGDSVQLMSNLENALGSDLSLSNCPGLAATGYFPFYATGNAGGFAFHDTHPREARIYAPEIFWFANLTKDPALAVLYKELLAADHAPVTPNNIFYYYQGQTSALSELPMLPLDKHFGKAEIATMRSDWSRSDTNIFVGMHAGYNSEVHGHFDIGSFEYHTGHVKFATEMGSDNYNLPGYWERVSIYVQRAEGHNVYVLDPDESAGQSADADAVITQVISEADRAIYTIDMTEAYAHQGVTHALRSFMLTDNRRIFTVQDEISSANVHDVHWFWHTPAETTLDQDGSSVLLQSGDKCVTLHFDSNVPFTIVLRKSTPLATSPQNDAQLSHMTDTVNLIEVLFRTTEEVNTFRCTAIPGQ